jgi:hypothetical protein
MDQARWKVDRGVASWRHAGDDVASGGGVASGSYAEGDGGSACGSQTLSQETVTRATEQK